MSTYKTKIGVLRGGPSHEYFMSLKTGAAILKTLREDLGDKYEPYDIFIDRQGVWHLNGLPRQPEQIVQGMDLVINALHGPFGEGGYISRILNSVGVAHTGPSERVGAITQDKAKTKEVLKKSGIKTPFHIIIDSAQYQNNAKQGIISETFRSVPMPAIIKPLDQGSSLGVSVAKTKADLEKSFDQVFKFSDKALVEEYIPGVEISCGIIRDFRDELLYALMPIEIIKDSHITYNNKQDGVQSKVPARITQTIKDSVIQLAKKVHERLHLGPYSRSDFIIHPKRGIFFLEVNALPALHDHSLFHESLKAVGITPAQFLEHIISRSRY